MVRVKVMVDVRVRVRYRLVKRLAEPKKDHIYESDSLSGVKRNIFIEFHYLEGVFHMVDICLCICIRTNVTTPSSHLNLNPNPNN